MIFSFASATAKDVQTLMISRFFGGVFGGAPLSNVGGVLADIWPATQRGAALIIWGLAVMTGPLIAPVIGGALVISLPTTGWRWTGYVYLPRETIQTWLLTPFEAHWNHCRNNPCSKHDMD